MKEKNLIHSPEATDVTSQRKDTIKELWIITKEGLIKIPNITVGDIVSLLDRVEPCLINDTGKLYFDVKEMCNRLRKMENK